MSYGKMDRVPAEDVRLRRLLARRNKVPTNLPIALDGDSLEQTTEGLRVRPGGIGPTELGLVSNEAPAGTINGMNDTFQLQNKPIDETLRVFLSGVFMTPGIDYARVSDDLIVFEPAQIPQTGDILTVHYQKEM